MIIRSYRLLPDERLARLAGEGSDSAFAALHHRYDALLHGYARSIARDADDAADALQNAWIAALIALRADRRRAPVRPWLFRIAHNAAIDVLRRKSAALRPIDRGFLTSVPGADEQYDRTETMAEVVGDMRDLPTNQRSALVMRELADLDYSEIAIALSTSEGNARQLVFAARDGLRETRAGRALPCESVRGVLARADGRELRRRRLRAHLDACQDCRAYATSVERPARKVAGWAPTPAVLQSIFAAAGGSGAALTQGGSFAVLAKGAVAATLVIAGVGTGEYVAHHGGSGPAAPAASARALEAGGVLSAETLERKTPPAQNPVATARQTVPATTVRTATVKATRTSTAFATQTRASSTVPVKAIQPAATREVAERVDDDRPPPLFPRRRNARTGDADSGTWDGGGSGTRDYAPGPSQGDFGGARTAGGAGRDCDPQAADSSATDSSRRERMPSLR